jgi:hypothetical protein
MVPRFDFRASIGPSHSGYITIGGSPPTFQGFAPRLNDPPLIGQLSVAIGYAYQLALGQKGKVELAPRVGVGGRLWTFNANNFAEEDADAVSQVETSSVMFDAGLTLRIYLVKRVAVSFDLGLTASEPLLGRLRLQDPLEQLVGPVQGRVSVGLSFRP